MPHSLGHTKMDVASGVKRTYSLEVYHFIESVPLMVTVVAFTYGIYAILVFNFCYKDDNCCMRHTVFGPKKFLVWLGKGVVKSHTGLSLLKNYRHIKINGKEVPESVLALFGTRLLIYGIVTFTVCWHVGAVSVSSVCDSTFDCFATTDIRTYERRSLVDVVRLILN